MLHRLVFLLCSIVIIICQLLSSSISNIIVFVTAQSTTTTKNIACRIDGLPGTYDSNKKFLTVPTNQNPNLDYNSINNPMQALSISATENTAAHTEKCASILIRGTPEYPLHIRGLTLTDGMNNYQDDPWFENNFEVVIENVVCVGSTRQTSSGEMIEPVMVTNSQVAHCISLPQGNYFKKITIRNVTWLNIESHTGVIRHLLVHLPPVLTNIKEGIVIEDCKMTFSTWTFAASQSGPKFIALALQPMTLTGFENIDQFSFKRNSLVVNEMGCFGSSVSLHPRLLSLQRISSSSFFEADQNELIIKKFLPSKMSFSQLFTAVMFNFGQNLNSNHQLEFSKMFSIKNSRFEIHHDGPTDSSGSSPTIDFLTSSNSTPIARMILLKLNVRVTLVSEKFILDGVNIAVSNFSVNDAHVSLNVLYHESQVLEVTELLLLQNFNITYNISGYQHLLACPVHISDFSSTNRSFLEVVAQDWKVNGIIGGAQGESKFSTKTGGCIPFLTNSGQSRSFYTSCGAFNFIGKGYGHTSSTASSSLNGIKNLTVTRMNVSVDLDSVTACDPETFDGVPFEYNLFNIPRTFGDFSQGQNPIQFTNIDFHVSASPRSFFGSHRGIGSSPSITDCSTRDWDTVSSPRRPASLKIHFLRSLSSVEKAPELLFSDINIFYSAEKQIMNGFCRYSLPSSFRFFGAGQISSSVGNVTFRRILLNGFFSNGDPEITSFSNIDYNHRTQVESFSLFQMDKSTVVVGANFWPLTAFTSREQVLIDDLRYHVQVRDRGLQQQAYGLGDTVRLGSSILNTQLTKLIFTNIDINISVYQLYTDYAGPAQAGFEANLLRVKEEDSFSIISGISDTLSMRNISHHTISAGMPRPLPYTAPSIKQFNYGPPLVTRLVLFEVPTNFPNSLAQLLFSDINITRNEKVRQLPFGAVQDAYYLKFYLVDRSAGTTETQDAVRSPEFIVRNVHFDFEYESFLSINAPPALFGSGIGFGFGSGSLSPQPFRIGILTFNYTQRTSTVTDEIKSGSKLVRFRKFEMSDITSSVVVTRTHDAFQFSVLASEATILNCNQVNLNNVNVNIDIKENLLPFPIDISATANSANDPQFYFYAPTTRIVLFNIKRIHSESDAGFFSQNSLYVENNTLTVPNIFSTNSSDTILSILMLEPKELRQHTTINSGFVFRENHIVIETFEGGQISVEFSDSSRNARLPAMIVPFIFRGLLSIDSSMLDVPHSDLPSLVIASSDINSRSTIKEYKNEDQTSPNYLQYPPYINFLLKSCSVTVKNQIRLLSGDHQEQNDDKETTMMNRENIRSISLKETPFAVVVNIFYFGPHQGLVSSGAPVSILPDRMLPWINITLLERIDFSMKPTQSEYSVMYSFGHWVFWDDLKIDIKSIQLERVMSVKTLEIFGHMSIENTKVPSSSAGSKTSSTLVIENQNVTIWKNFTFLGQFGPADERHALCGAVGIARFKGRFHSIENIEMRRSEMNIPLLYFIDEIPFVASRGNNNFNYNVLGIQAFRFERRIGDDDTDTQLKVFAGKNIKMNIGFKSSLDVRNFAKQQLDQQLENLQEIRSLRIDCFFFNEGVFGSPSVPYVEFSDNEINLVAGSTLRRASSFTASIVSMRMSSLPHSTLYGNAGIPTYQNVTSDISLFRVMRNTVKFLNSNVGNSANSANSGKNFIANTIIDSCTLELTVLSVSNDYPVLTRIFDAKDNLIRSALFEGDGNNQQLQHRLYFSEAPSSSSSSSTSSQQQQQQQQQQHSSSLSINIINFKSLENINSSISRVSQLIAHVGNEIHLPNIFEIHHRQHQNGRNSIFISNEPIPSCFSLKYLRPPSNFAAVSAFQYIAVGNILNVSFIDVRQKSQQEQQQQQQQQQSSISYLEISISKNFAPTQQVSPEIATMTVRNNLLLVQDYIIIPSDDAEKNENQQNNNHNTNNKNNNCLLIRSSLFEMVNPYNGLEGGKCFSYYNLFPPTKSNNHRILAVGARFSNNTISVQRRRMTMEDSPGEISLFPASEEFLSDEISAVQSSSSSGTIPKIGDTSVSLLSIEGTKNQFFSGPSLIKIEDNDLSGATKDIMNRVSLFSARRETNNDFNQNHHQHHRYFGELTLNISNNNLYRRKQTSSSSLRNNNENNNKTNVVEYGRSELLNNTCNLFGLNWILYCNIVEESRVIEIARNLQRCAPRGKLDFRCELTDSRSLSLPTPSRESPTVSRSVTFSGNETTKTLKETISETDHNANSSSASLSSSRASETLSLSHKITPSAENKSSFSKSFTHTESYHPPRRPILKAVIQEEQAKIALASVAIFVPQVSGAYLSMFRANQISKIFACGRQLTLNPLEWDSNPTFLRIQSPSRDLKRVALSDPDLRNQEDAMDTHRGALGGNLILIVGLWLVLFVGIKIWTEKKKTEVERDEFRKKRRQEMLDKKNRKEENHHEQQLFDPTSPQDFEQGLLLGDNVKEDNNNAFHHLQSLKSTSKKKSAQKLAKRVQEDVEATITFPGLLASVVSVIGPPSCYAVIVVITVSQENDFSTLIYFLIGLTFLFFVVLPLGIGIFLKNRVVTLDESGKKKNKKKSSSSNTKSKKRKITIVDLHDDDDGEAKELEEIVINNNNNNDQFSSLSSPSSRTKTIIANNDIDPDEEALILDPVPPLDKEYQEEDKADKKLKSTVRKAKSLAQLTKAAAKARSRREQEANCRSTKLLINFFFHPTHKWRESNFVNRWDGAFAEARFAWYVCYDTILASVVGGLAAGSFSCPGRECCLGVSVTCLILSAFHTLFLFIKKPYLCKFDAYLNTLNSVSVSAISVMSLIEVVRGGQIELTRTESADHSDDGSAKQALNVVTVVVAYFLLAASCLQVLVRGSVFVYRLTKRFVALCCKIKLDENENDDDDDDDDNDLDQENKKNNKQGSSSSSSERQQQQQQQRQKPHRKIIRIPSPRRNTTSRTSKGYNDHDNDDSQELFEGEPITVDDLKDDIDDNLSSLEKIMEDTKEQKSSPTTEEQDRDENVFDQCEEENELLKNKFIDHHNQEQEEEPAIPITHNIDRPQSKKKKKKRTSSSSPRKSTLSNDAEI